MTDDSIRLFWAVSPDGKGPAYGPYREGDRYHETFARVNGLAVYCVHAEVWSRGVTPPSEGTKP